MSITSNWLAHKDGWQERYNQLIGYVNDYENPDNIKPKLTAEELDWYTKSVDRLKAENKAIEEQCKALGTEPWRTYYGKM